MPNRNDFPMIFQRLKKILQPLAPPLVVQADTPEYYALTLANPSKKAPPGFFVSAVQIRKTYVTFHLMPISMRPDLLEHCSPQLKKRMQGKACFNFTRLDETLMTELEQLTTTSIERFRHLRLP